MMQPEFWYSLPVLTGRSVRLEPLSLEHTAGLFAAAGTGATAERTFRWLPGGRPPSTVAEAVRLVAGALAERARGERLPYAVLDAQTGEFAGSISFGSPNPTRRSVEVTHHWLGGRWAGGGRDAETALLLLTYAFNGLGAVRLSWLVAAGDSGLRATLERYGLRLEGVLRRHRVDADGTFGDTALYAVTDADWADVRDKITARL